jgi:hypothetical protein
VQRAKQLMSKDNWTPFIDPLNNVMSKIGAYGGKNRPKHVFQHFLARFGHELVSIMAHRVTIWGHEYKEHHG